MFIKKLAGFAILSASAIACFAYSGSALAVNLTYSSGIFRTAGVTNQGAFSANVNNSNFITIDFNDPKYQNGNFKGNNLVEYIFSQGTYSTQHGSTGIFNSRWSPAGVNGEVNQSNYLGVYQGNSVSIKAKKGRIFNYFGLDIGALSGGNTFELLKGGKTVGKWNYEQLNNIAQVVGTNMNGQKNGVFEFFSESANDNFDQIRLSQVASGGFESDNHTFHIGTGKFYVDPQSVPEPSLTVGMLAVGGMFLRLRRKQK